MCFSTAREAAECKELLQVGINNSTALQVVSSHLQPRVGSCVPACSSFLEQLLLRLGFLLSPQHCPCECSAGLHCAQLLPTAPAPQRNKECPEALLRLEAELCWHSLPRQCPVQLLCDSRDIQGPQRAKVTHCSRFKLQTAADCPGCHSTAANAAFQPLWHA